MLRPPLFAPLPFLLVLLATVSCDESPKSAAAPSTIATTAPPTTTERAKPKTMPDLLVDEEGLTLTARASS